jgi:DNA-binding CsgD family transcriptional regulator
MVTKTRAAKAVPVISNPLTPRERQLLQHLSQGESRISIALQWGVSVGTIQNHVRMVHARLGVKTSEQAIAEAFRRGYLK